MSINTFVKRLAAGVGALMIALASGCSDDTARPTPDPATTTTLSATNGTEIDRSAVPSGAAPGDGSGQGKAPEGNTNSGDSPTSSR